MTKAELIAKADELHAHYKTLTEYNQQEPVFKRLILMDDKIKHFPTVKLVKQSGEIVAVFASPRDAQVFLMNEYPKTYKAALENYQLVEGPTGFRKGFMQNWNTYSDHTMELRTMDEDVPENLVQMAWDYYGCL